MYDGREGSLLMERVCLNQLYQPKQLSHLQKIFSRRKKKGTYRILRHGWLKHKAGYTKLINVDAAFDPDAGTGGSGAILHDDNGLFPSCGCCRIPFEEDAVMAEAR